MKPIVNIFVFLFFVCSIASYSQIASISIANAQLKLDSMQIKGKDVFKVIDEKAVTLDNGDVITTAVCFCENMPGGHSDSYSSFTRTYGLTTKTGKKWNPVYQNIIYWENNQYLVKYHDYGPPGEYLEEGWFALVDGNLKVLNVFEEEGISEKYYSVKKNGKYGTISSSLYESVPFAFDSLSELSGRAEVEIMVKERSFYTYSANKNKKWGLITTNSDTIVPFKYDFLENSFYGNMIAKNNGKWGIINQLDSAIVPFIYDSIFRKHGTFLLKGKKWALLPSEFKYKNAQHQFEEIAFNNGRGDDLGRIGNKWYFFNDQKIKETDIGYDGFHFDKDSGPFVCVKKGELFGIYNSSRGKWETQFIYSKIVDVLYEREWVGHTNYPVYHFFVIQDGESVDFGIRD